MWNLVNWQVPRMWLELLLGLMVEAETLRRLTERVWDWGSENLRKGLKRKFGFSSLKRRKV